MYASHSPGERTCILYARKSTDREDKQILSIDAQLDALHEFAGRQGLTIVAELTERQSAREPGRPIFGKLLADVAAGRVERILAWKLDRLARNPIDGGALIHHLGKGNLQELVTPEGTYTGSGDSKFMLSVLFGAATKMTDDLSQGVRRGIRDLLKRGRIAGRPPLGYTKDRDRHGYRGAGRVVPDPQRFRLVASLWRGFLTGGRSLADLWRDATRAGLTTREGPNTPSRPIALNYVYDLVQNRFYAGETILDGVTYKLEHKPMVTVAEFERAQALLKKWTSQSQAHPARHDFLFAGILRCGPCGRLLSGEEHVKASGSRFVYYRCARRRAGRLRCYQPAPSEPRVLADLRAHLDALVLPPELIAWTRDAVEAWLDLDGADHAAKAESAHARRRDLDARLRRLTDLAVAGGIEGEEFLRRKAEIETARSLLSVEDENAATASWRERVDLVLHKAAALGDILNDDYPNDVRRARLREVYANCMVTDRIVRPVLAYPFTLLESARPPANLSAGGDANQPRPRDIALRVRKNARSRSARERAFCAWWTKVLEVRTIGATRDG